jgi:Penicillin-insensitive murein endopeptidase
VEVQSDIDKGRYAAALLAIGKAKFGIQFTCPSEFSCGCMSTVVRFILIILLAGIGPVLAQDEGSTDSLRAASAIDHTPPGTLNPEPLPPLANPNAPHLPAKELFARKLTPLPGLVRPIGSYADGCLAGAVALPITGPTWQVMRLSRDRNWGTPRLVKFIERLGDNAKKVGSDFAEILPQEGPVGRYGLVGVPSMPRECHLRRTFPNLRFSTAQQRRWPYNGPPTRRRLRLPETDRIPNCSARARTRLSNVLWTMT